MLMRRILDHDGTDLDGHIWRYVHFAYLNRIPNRDDECYEEEYDIEELVYSEAAFNTKDMH